jgi:hypothetical protein
VQTPYSSGRATNIFQRQTVRSKPSLFKPKGWTDSLESYINEAGKLRTLILRNRRLAGQPYTWHVTINVESVQTPAEIKTLWDRACRSLRDSGIVALWVREPTKSNKVHYHLILRTQITRKELEKVIKAAMPKKQPGQKRAGWHKSIKPVTDDWQLAHYVTKAKIAGSVRGRRVDDYYASKRLLFVSGLPFNKVGMVGDFWVKPKGKMWDDVKAVEKKIAEGLAKPNVRRLAKYAYDLIGGYFKLKDIERSIGAAAGEPEVRGWIESLLHGEWAKPDAGEDG